MSEEFRKSGRRSCFLMCVSLLVLFGTIIGFFTGLLVASFLAKHGQFINLDNQGNACNNVAAYLQFSYFELTANFYQILCLSTFDFMCKVKMFHLGQLTEM